MKEKIKDKLKQKINREPSEIEIENAQKDALLICEVLIDEIKAIKKFLNI